MEQTDGIDMSARNPSAAPADAVFGFGKNWQSFVRHACDEHSVERAVDSLRRLLRVDSLQGRTFLDVGCGSGLFSLAAVRLGARVVAFDADPDAVAASSELRDRAGVGPRAWRISCGSILDQAFLTTIESADVVYAWGSLHHTGAMWSAIDNAARLVVPGGTLSLAIYNEVSRRIDGSRQWRAIKRFYNRSSRPVRHSMEYTYLALRAAADLAALRSPFARAHGRPRGMDYRHDVRDWLGGFPYEYATPAAVVAHVRDGLGFELVHLDLHEGHACNEFVFRRTASR
jgi:2-polyprenyl-6-hydroxyphenyl methylase/3-demethylubiquinone-9 3-methyltransferase